MRGRSGDNCLYIQPARQYSIHPTGRTEATGDEGITDRRVTGLQQQLGLKPQGDVFGKLPGTVLNIVGVLERGLQLADVRSQTFVAMTVAQLAEQHISQLQAAFKDTADIQYRARQLTEDIALGLQAKLLLEAGNAAVSDAFIASRLGSAGRVYGTLPRGLDVEAIVARSTPQGF